MPLICDEWAKPQLGSGCVKITPAHDPNDYAVWMRHQQDIESINILNEDGTLNANAGPYAGLDRFVARERVVQDLRAQDLLEAMEERAIELGHSDRSKDPIEPYLSRQWFVQMGDREGGVLCGRGTANAFVAPGLAQAAMDAAQGTWRSSPAAGWLFTLTRCATATRTCSGSRKNATGASAGNCGGDIVFPSGPGRIRARPGRGW